MLVNLLKVVQYRTLQVKLYLVKKKKRSSQVCRVVFYKDQAMHLTCEISRIISGTLLSIINMLISLISN